MRVRVLTTPSINDGVVIVRRISWQKRCEEQLDQIISKLKNMKSNLETTKTALESMIHE